MSGAVAVQTVHAPVNAPRRRVVLGVIGLVIAVDIAASIGRGGDDVNAGGMDGEPQAPHPRRETSPAVAAMRPFEALLLLCDFTALVSLAAGSWRGKAWPASAAMATATLAVVAAAVQAAVERPDWRMAPAYGLAAALMMIAFRRQAASLLETRIFGVVGALGLLLAIALPLTFPVFRLPPPDGPHAIGSRTYHWVSATRDEPFTSNPGDRRQLMVQIWYPAEPVAGARRLAYIEDGATLAPLARLLGLPGFIFGHLTSSRTNAVADTPVAKGGGRFPLLVFSHGRAGYRQHNSALIEHLVSHGYVVAAIDHPHAASGVRLPDGRIIALDPRMSDRAFVERHIPVLASDVSMALDELARLDAQGPFARRLDLERVGVMGVSLGGETTALACLRDPRPRACMIIDVWIPDAVLAEGLDQPTLLLTRDLATMRAEGWREADAIETDSEMRALFQRLQGGGYLVRAPGLYHLDFADTALMSPVTGILGLTGPGDPARARRIVNDFALAFFDRHLKGAAAPLLDDSSGRYPDALVERRPSTPP